MPLFLLEHSPPGRMCEFTSCGDWRHILTATNYRPSCPSWGPPGYVGSSVSRSRWLDPATPSCWWCLDDGQTSGRLTTSSHGAHRSDSFNWCPQGERRLTIATQATTNHTFSGRRTQWFNRVSVNSALHFVGCVCKGVVAKSRLWSLTVG